MNVKETHYLSYLELYASFKENVANKLKAKTSNKELVKSI